MILFIMISFTALKHIYFSHLFEYLKFKKSILVYLNNDYEQYCK